MRFNPLLDVLVEVGYRGHAMRCVAHRSPGGMYSSLLQVRDLKHRVGRALFEHEFDGQFANADAAIERALGEGHRIVEARLDALEDEVKAKLTEAV